MLERIADEVAMYLFIGGLPMWFAWTVFRGQPRPERVRFTLLLSPVFIVVWTVVWELLLGRPVDRAVFEHGVMAFGASGLAGSVLLPDLLLGTWRRPVMYRAWYLGPAAIMSIHLIQRGLDVHRSGDDLVAWFDWSLSALMVVHASIGPRPRWMALHLGAAAALPWIIATAFDATG